MNKLLFPIIKLGIRDRKLSSTINTEIFPIKNPIITLNDPVNVFLIEITSGPFFCLETSKNELKTLIQDRFKSDDVVKTLEQDRVRLQTELDLVKRDLEERSRELQKERTRIENMIRQEQVTKHFSSLHR